jgi:hypothetical protein
LGPLAAVAAIAGVVGWGTLFLYNGIEQERTEIQNLKTETLLTEQQTQAMKNFRSIATKREKEISRIGKFFINTERPIEFIEDMEALASSTKNKLILTIADSAEKNAFSFNVSVEGTRQTTFTFLKLLELMPHKISLKQFGYQVAVEDESAGSNALARISLTIQVAKK